MQTIGKELIKELREKSGAGLMDCKNALKQTNGKIDESIKYLREKGLAQAAKKSSRAASEGIIAAKVSPENDIASIMEINCETDFVTKTDDFKEIISTLSNISLEEKPQTLQHLYDLKLSKDDKPSVKDWIGQKIAIIGENIVLRRYNFLTAAEGEFISAYVHGNGNIGVLLKVRTENKKTHSEQNFHYLMKDICMHIAASAPLYIEAVDVNAEDLKNEKDIYRKQILDQGKPENIVDKIVEGKIKKYYGEVCLLEQEHIRENKVKVNDVIEKTAKELGEKIKVSYFIRFALGG